MQHCNREMRAPKHHGQPVKFPHGIVRLNKVKIILVSVDPVVVSLLSSRPNGTERLPTSAPAHLGSRKWVASPKNIRQAGEFHFPESQDLGSLHR